MRLMGEVGLVENRGSGIRAMLAALREAHLEPPRFRDTRNFFRVTFSNHTLLDPATVAWLGQFAGLPLNSRQRAGLAYLYHNDQMTNADYCRLNNVDTVLATRELRGLVDSGVLVMHGSRRWAYYMLRVASQPGTARHPALWEEYELNLRQRTALEFLQEHGTITTAQYVSITGSVITEQTARKDLRALEEMGLVKRVGRTRGTHYVLIDSE